MNADHESASLEAVDLQPAEGKPYLQAYLEAYLEPYLETYLEARPRPEDPEPAEQDAPPLPSLPREGRELDAPGDDEEAPDQELVDREPYLQAYLEPYLEACLEPAEPPATDLEAIAPEAAEPEPADTEPTGPEAADPEAADLDPVHAQPADLRASDFQAPGPEPTAPLDGAELDEPAPGPEPADPPPLEPEIDPELVDPGHDDLQAAQVRRRAEAARLATSIRWMPPAPVRQSWAPLASASLVAGQVRRQLVPCLSALRSVGLDGCAYQLQRLDHVLERIATVPEATVACGPDM